MNSDGGKIGQLII